MGDNLFPLHEVGSLAKPRWRTKGLRQPLTTSDLNEAEEWASRLGIVNYHDLAKEVLKNGPDRQRKLLQLSTLYGLRLFEKAGLDNDGVGGEQQRVEMYEHVIKNVEGMRFLGHVNSFDYKYFRKAVAEGAVDRSQQIDEPALTTHPERAELEMFVEAWNETVKGFNCKFSDHTCYPNEVGYRLLAEYTPELEKCSQLTLEFANRDSPELGIDGGAREGYQALRYFVDNGYDGEFGIGAIHVHDYTGVAPKQSGLVSGRDIIESPELVRDRVLYASKIVGDPAKIWVNPDCGLRTRTWDVALAKLTNLSKGTELARKEWA